MTSKIPCSSSILVERTHNSMDFLTLVPDLLAPTEEPATTTLESAIVQIPSTTEHQPRALIADVRAITFATKIPVLECSASVPNTTATSPDVSPIKGVPLGHA